MRAFFSKAFPIPTDIYTTAHYTVRDGKLPLLTFTSVISDERELNGLACGVQASRNWFSSRRSTSNTSPGISTDAPSFRQLASEHALRGYFPSVSPGASRARHLTSAACGRRRGAADFGSFGSNLCKLHFTMGSIYGRRLLFGYDWARMRRRGAQAECMRRGATGPGGKQHGRRGADWRYCLK